LKKLIYSTSSVNLQEKEIGQQVVSLALSCYNAFATMPNIVNLQHNTRTAPKEQKKAPVRAQESDRNGAQADETNLPAVLSWHAAEYMQVKKHPDWYWAVGILTLGLFVTALVFNNFLFAVFMLLAGFTVAMYGARPARVVEFKLSGEGIHIHGSVYPYETLKSFWIFYHPPDVKEISIESQKMIMPHIKIPLGDMNHITVRSYLQQFMHERPQEESLVDVAARYFGF